MKTDHSFFVEGSTFFRKNPFLLNRLLADKTTKANIIWATDDYLALGKGYGSKDQIKSELISGEHQNLIKPRVQKILAVQTDRSRSMAEVFTPAWICNMQNNRIDAGWFGDDIHRFNIETQESWKTIHKKVVFPENEEKSWIDYVEATQLEISCGEAPYLTSRYDVASGKPIEAKNRIGLLDRKLRVIGENVNSKEDWEKYAIEALKSVYGFEWQGDNVFLARQNLLFTFLEFFHDRFKEDPSSDFTEKAVDIITWNIWQMDGIKCVVPMSCHDVVDDCVQESLFGEAVKREVYPCPGCAKGDVHKHTGIYCLIMDWNLNKTIRFVDVIGGKRHAKVRRS